jgi:hypothetical protein
MRKHKKTAKECFGGGLVGCGLCGPCSLSSLSSIARGRDRQIYTKTLTHAHSSSFFCFPPPLSSFHHGHESGRQREKKHVYIYMQTKERHTHAGTTVCVCVLPHCTRSSHSSLGPFHHPHSTIHSVCKSEEAASLWPSLQPFHLQKTTKTTSTSKQT